MKLLTPSGEPAVGRELQVSYYDGHYGGVPVCEELVPEDGIVYLNDISRDVPEDLPFGPYTATVDEQRLGFFRLGPE